MDTKDLELPLGKRSKIYRMFELLPAAISYGAILLLIVLSIINPVYASVYLLVLIITMLVRVIFMTVHLLVANRKYKLAAKTDWSQRLADLEDPKSALGGAGRPKSKSLSIHYDNLEKIAQNPDTYPEPSQLYNAVIIAAYNEPYEVIEPTLDAIINGDYDASRVILVFAYEQRGGAGIKQTADRLKQKYSQYFREFLNIEHPEGLKDEVVGKGPNITYAAHRLEDWCQQNHIAKDNVIITTLDCDNKPHEKFFDYLTYEYIVHEDRQHLSFQPLAIYFTNIWDVPAPMRVIATGNSFWTMVVSMRPHLLHNFAAHSQPMKALSGMGYWSKRSIVEDGHQYWRSYFYFAGDYRVIPIYVPVYQDAVLAGSLLATAKAQFKQLRRWAYGVSDIPYVAVRIFSKKRRNVPFIKGLSHLFYIIDGHTTLAIMPPLIAFGAWVPILINPEAKYFIEAQNLPITVSSLQIAALTSLAIPILLSLAMLPPRPARYKRYKTVFMVLHWVFIPITALAYNSAAAFNAQTHLFLGKYLDKFDVTEKATYETAQKDKQDKKRKK